MVNSRAAVVRSVGEVVRLIWLAVGKAYVTGYFGRTWIQSNLAELLHVGGMGGRREELGGGRGGEEQETAGLRDCSERLGVWSATSQWREAARMESSPRKRGVVFPCAYHNSSGSSLHVFVRVPCVLVFEHSLAGISAFLMEHDGFMVRKIKGFV